MHAGSRIFTLQCGHLGYIALFDPPPPLQRSFKLQVRKDSKKTEIYENMEPKKKMKKGKNDTAVTHSLTHYL